MPVYPSVNPTAIGAAVTGLHAGATLIGTGGSLLSQVDDVAVASYFRSGGVGVAPAWSTLKLPNAAARGDIFFASAADTMGRLADVAAGSLLLSGGVGLDPLYSDPSKLFFNNTSGRLGIGTNAPTKDLDVAGDFRLEKDLFIEGSGIFVLETLSIWDIEAAENTTPGGAGTILGAFPGKGGAATAILPGGTGGGHVVFAAEGGDGSALQVAGKGGGLTYLAGDAGPDGGGGGNDGGDAVWDAGLATGAGTNGVVGIGTNQASAVNIGKAGRNTKIFGTLLCDQAVTLTTLLTGTEQSGAPAAPAANGWTMFAVDSGAGKTVLKVLFNTGAAQVVATQP